MRLSKNISADCVPLFNIFLFEHSSIKLVWGSQVGFVSVLEQKVMIALISAEFDSEAIISLASTSYVSPLLRKAKFVSLQRRKSL